MTPPSPYAQQHYQQQAVSTAGPAQLVLMAYDGILLALQRVELAAQATPPDLGTFNKELQRAQALITELQIALDHDNGSPIAGYLGTLYDFCLHTLVKANLAKDTAKLDSVREVVQGIRDAWDEACCRPNSPGVQAMDVQGISVSA